jgi:Polyketide cyclase / dehydrase and lipid transport
MATIRKERTIEADPDAVWDALRDWGAVHERLVPGFVTDTRLDGEDRIVTFFNGAVAREVLVDRSEEDRRLVWSVVDGPYTHHNGAAQVLAGDDGTTRFVWIADLLPDEAAEPTAAMMEQGVETVKRTLEANA